MKITEEKLKNSMVEMYTYYFRQARLMHMQDEADQYEAGKADGAVDALGAIMLQVFGGKDFYKIWTMAIAWADDKEKEEEKDG